MRVGAMFGPEVVAALLAAGVVVVVGLALVVGPRFPAAAQAPTPSIEPSASEPSPEPSPTPDLATPRALLQVIDGLLAEQTALASAVSGRHPDIRTIADRLRGINAALNSMDKPLADFSREDTTGVGERIRTIHDLTRDLVTDTQRASISFGDAYVEGGQRVVEAIGPLVAIRLEVLAMIDGTWTPSAGPVQSGSIAPSP